MPRPAASCRVLLCLYAKWFDWVELFKWGGCPRREVCGDGPLRPGPASTSRRNVGRRKRRKLRNGPGRTPRVAHSRPRPSFPGRQRPSPPEAPLHRPSPLVAARGRSWLPVSRPRQPVPARNCSKPGPERPWPVPTLKGSFNNTRRPKCPYLYLVSKQHFSERIKKKHWFISI